MSEIEASSTEPIETKYADTDPDAALLYDLTQMYPSLDIVMVKVALRNHRTCVELFGEEYTPEQLEEYVGRYPTPSPTSDDVNKISAECKDELTT